MDHRETNQSTPDVLLDSLLDAANMGRWSADLATGAATRDATFNRILGLPAVPSQGRLGEWAKLIHPDDTSWMVEAWQRALDQQVPFQSEFRIIRDGGEVRWLRAIVQFQHGEDHSRSKVSGFTQDITEIRAYETRLEEALRQEQDARSEAEVLTQVAREVSENLDLQTVLQRTTDAATRLTGAEFGAFFYNCSDPTGDSFRLFALSGAPRESFDGFEMPRNTPLFDVTFRGEASVRLCDVLQDDRYGKVGPHFGLPAGHLPVRSYLAVPVVSRTGEVLGGLFFAHSETGVFTDRAERAAETIAAQAATAIDNANLVSRVRESGEMYRQLAAVLPVAVYTCTSSGAISYFNDSAVQLWGRVPVADSADDLFCGSHLLFRPDGTPLKKSESHMAMALAEGVSFRQEHVLLIRPDGSRVNVRQNIDPIVDIGGKTVGAISVFEDVTGLAKAEEALHDRQTWLQAQSKALAASMNGASLEDSLNHLVDAAVRAIGQGARAAFFLSDEAGGTLHHVTGMSADYAAAVAGFEVSVDSLACGLAIATGQPILTSDVLEDPRWESWRGMAEKFGYRACWSFPLKSSNDSFFGTLAIYSPEPREATDREVELATHLTHTASMILRGHKEAAVRKAAERAVRESEYRFRSFANTAPAMLWVSNADSQCTFLSQAWHEYTGTSGETGLGTGWLSSIHPEDKESVLEVFAAANRAREPFSADFRLRTSDGEFRWVIGMGRPQFSEDGIHQGFVGSVLDVHERKLAEQAQAQLAAIVESSDDAIVGKNLQGLVTSWNAGAERLFGYSAEEMIGQPVTLLFPKDRLDEEPRIIERIIAGERIDHYETVRKRKDGTLIDVSLSISPVKDGRGRTVGASKIARNVTERKVAEEALKRSHQTFFNLVANAPVGVYVVDSNFRIAYVSQGAEKVFQNVKPLIGHDFADAMQILWPEPFATEAIDHFRRTLETGEPYVAPSLTQERKDTPDLESYEWEIHRIVMADGSHGVVCYFFESTDIRRTERALRESEERFRMIADNISTLAWTCDTLADVTWYNKRWLEYTGLDFEDTKGYGWMKCHHPDHIDHVMESVRRANETGQIWEDTFPLRGADGTYRWFLSRAYPIHDSSGKIVRWFGTNTDVTKQLELSEALQQADRRKDEFLATLSHELRNPLAPIRSALELIQLAGDDKQALEQARSTMERQLSQLVRLVDDLLDLSRISQDKIDLRKEKIDLRAVFTQALESVEPVARRMNHELVVQLPERPVMIEADLVRIAQALGNLLNNACKYTDPGGRIVLAAERDGSEVVVRVTDTGIGIPAEHIGRVFDIFAQVDRSLDRAQGGLGIGLSLAKRLAELHGGKVEAKSGGAGRGSTFTIRLPALPDDDAEAPAPTGGSAAPAKRKILVVDDNVDAARTLAMVLKALGHGVETAHDGFEAVRIASNSDLDLILLDIGMPGMNGYETARKIREQARQLRPTLVALTGWGQEKDRQLSEEAGFDAHVVKPVELDRLKQLLN